jgi:hypothetical protein
MCVFFGMYYPKQSADFESCKGQSIIGYGNQSCSQEQTCISACPAADAPQVYTGGVKVGPCWEHCVAAACDGATDALLPLLGCVYQNCPSECSVSGDACTACALSKCRAPVQACQAQTCH